MKLRVSLAICSVLALLAIRSRAADDTQAPSQPQKRETVAKPMTDKQKKAADAKLRKELESPYKKWLDEEVVWIISDEERAAFKALQTDDERQSFIEDFWRRRDPTPDTEENEFQEEHYRRIAWANDRFASGIPGWKTDRGQIYIKFGPPDENDSHTSGGPGQRSVDEGGGSTTFYPYEIWRYRYLDCCGSDVQIEFIDTTLTNEYRITMDPSEKDALAHIPGAGLTLNEQMGLSSKSDRFTRTDGTELGTGTSPLPERMNMWNRLNQYVNLQKAPPVKFKDLEAAVYSTIKYNLLPLKVRADYVPINGASIQTYLTLQFEDKDLQFSQKEGVSEMKVNVQMRIENMTRKQVVPPIEDVLAMQVPSEMLQKIITGNSAIMQKSVTLLPGRYRLIAAAKDMIGNNTTVYEQALEVPRVDLRCRGFPAEKSRAQGAAPDEIRPEGGILEDPGEGLGDPLDAVGVDLECGISHDLGKGRDPGGDDRDPEGHGLEGGEPEPLVERREGEDGRHPVEDGQGAIGDESEEAHVVAHAALLDDAPQRGLLQDLVADDDELQVVVPRPFFKEGEGKDEALEVLVGLDVPRVEDVAAPDLVALAHPLLLVVLRLLEEARFDGARHDPEPLGVGGGEEVEDVLS